MKENDIQQISEFVRAVTGLFAFSRGPLGCFHTILDSDRKRGAGRLYLPSPPRSHSLS
jgi:hypothetical protein